VIPVIAAIDSPWSFCHFHSLTTRLNFPSMIPLDSHLLIPIDSHHHLSSGQFHISDFPRHILSLHYPFPWALYSHVINEDRIHPTEWMIFIKLNSRPPIIQSDRHIWTRWITVLACVLCCCLWLPSYIDYRKPRQNNWIIFNRYTTQRTELSFLSGVV